MRPSHLTSRTKASAKIQVKAWFTYLWLLSGNWAHCHSLCHNKVLPFRLGAIFSFNCPGFLIPTKLDHYCYCRASHFWGAHYFPMTGISLQFTLEGRREMGSTLPHYLNLLTHLSSEEGCKWAYICLTIYITRPIWIEPRAMSHEPCPWPKVSAL